MDSLFATYASSDDEEDEQKPQLPASHPPSKPSLSLFSSLPKPQSSPSSSLFSSLSPPKPSFQTQKQESSTPTSSNSSALFSFLPPPKSQTTLDLPLPKRVVQFRPPVPQFSSRFDNDDDDNDDNEDKEEEERERKKRSQLGQDTSVKSFLSSMPTPKNSGSLGGLSGSSGSGRRSIVETEGATLAPLSGDVNGVDDEVGFVSNVENNQENLVGGSNLGSYEVGVAGDQGCYGSYGGYDANGSSSVSDYGSSYQGYGNYDSSNWYHASAGEIGSATTMGGVESIASLGGKKRKNQVPTEIVEVNQDELMKNRPKEDKSKLTGIAFGPSYQPASTKGKPSKLHKRKHQIGSLYFDMRQKEMEFAERRAKGFLTKAETQAKYGW
ncbi:hypothetical protein BVRB_002110 [Beta vulgaris subsp. vulgaris]|uniref:Proline-rich protein PRCC n=1 Tax=Beta vulgaris subsp. vulgaris TaxID=3555 RepID=A0A0J8B4I7_BETVV|nr:uncharacterized protein LOC104883603 isoform X2 [Beta vulgaris subsp. vulgaris]KMS96099.1 hypothetical protein BVRB_002110 [Beta vulgaris subsp. vulgaris]